MKRLISILLLCLCVMSFAACKKEDEAKVIDIQAVKAEIIETVGIESPMDLGSDRLLALYGIEGADVEDSACFMSMGGTFADEIILVKAKDKDAADRVEECLNSKLQQVLNQSKNYSPEDYAIYQEIKVLREGNTLALFIHKDHKTMQEIFSK